MSWVTNRHHHLLKKTKNNPIGLIAQWSNEHVLCIKHCWPWACGSECARMCFQEVCCLLVSREEMWAGGAAGHLGLLKLLLPKQQELQVPILAAQLTDPINLGQLLPLCLGFVIHKLARTLWLTCWYEEMCKMPGLGCMHTWCMFAGLACTPAGQV